MNPKEKAQELVNKYGSIVLGENIYGEPFTMAQESLQEAKQCALIAVDEIIKSNPHSNPFNTIPYSTMDYWFEVKQEIENL